MHNKVYVVQNHAKYNEASGKMESKFDLSPAEKYGELVFLLSPIHLPKNPREIINRLHDKLTDFSSNDHLLLIGNPVFIAWACAVAASKNNGCVSVLQWNGKREKYFSVDADNLLCRK